MFLYSNYMVHVSSFLYTVFFERIENNRINIHTKQLRQSLKSKTFFLNSDIVVHLRIAQVYIL